LKPETLKPKKAEGSTALFRLTGFGRRKPPSAVRKDGFRVHCGAPGASACPTVVTLLTGNVENLETRAALCAGRGTAFARSPAAVPPLKKRRRAETRLPPHAKSFRGLAEYRDGNRDRYRDRRHIRIS